MPGTTPPQTSAGGGIPPAFQDLLQRVLDPEAPAALKMTAARGALPLPQSILLQVLVALTGDPDGSVAGTAAASLEEFGGDPARLTPLLEGADIDPAVLDWFGRHFGTGTDAAIVRAVIAHPETPEATLIALAADATGTVLESLLLNEARLSAHPDLLASLKGNPNLSARQARRVEEIAIHLAPPVAPAAPPAAGPEADGEPEPAPAEADGAAEAGAPPLSAGEGALPQDLAEAALEEEAEGGEEGSAVDRIARMSVPDKIQLALTADREERMILVRDGNRTVATAVLKSPKINEKDVAAIAGLRNVDPEVLRGVGRRRDWLKNYAVAHALVENPRTPVGIAMQLIQRLNNRDLKFLSRNKNISDTIRRAAKRAFESRTQPKKVDLRGKKH